MAAPVRIRNNMDDEDFFVEDILLNKSKGKRLNSKDKGKRGERDLCKVFSERFPNRKGFSRVIGSGAHGHGFMLTEQAKEVYTGDVVCPDGFRFSVECKYGYDHIDLCTLFEGGNKDIDKFLDQASKDAARVGKLPMLCWKKPRGGWLAFTKDVDSLLVFNTFMQYKIWTVVSLAEMLERLTDEFFFIPSK